MVEFDQGKSVQTVSITPTSLSHDGYDEQQTSFLGWLMFLKMLPPKFLTVMMTVDDFVDVAAKEVIWFLTQAASGLQE